MNKQKLAEEVKIGENTVALVDTKFAKEINKYKWNASWDRKTGQFRANKYSSKRDGTIGMSRFVAKLAGWKIEGKYIDHINGNTLDNRLCNLRVCTNSQNMQNSKKPNRKSSSKFKGVTWDKACNKWHATIMKEYKRYNLGYYNSEIEAAKAYNKAATQFFGGFAKVNKL